MGLKEIAFSWAKNILTILTKNINPKITIPDLMFHVVKISIIALYIVETCICSINCVATLSIY